MQILFLIISLFFLVGECKASDDGFLVTNSNKSTAYNISSASENCTTNEYDYAFCINYISPSGGELIDYLDSMKKSLPYWYIKAVYDSSGESECLVLVNGRSYDTYVTAWFYETWELDIKESKHSKNFISYGLEGREIMDAINFGFCAYLKKGEVFALEEMMKYGGGK